MIRFCILASLLVQALALQAKENSEPCFPGTLLSYYGTNTAPGVLAFQPTAIFSRQYGIYGADSKLVKDRNDHVNNYLLSLQTGITKTIDISLYLNTVYTNTEGEKSFGYGDTVLLFGFQFARDKKNSWVPDVRVIIGESFPTGRFDNLGTRARGLNATGTGSFETFVIFITRKIYYAKHPYNWNLNLYYIWFSDVDVRGVSVHGGGPDTRGRVGPGDFYIANLAFEYKFSYHLGAGIDIHYQHKKETTFRPRFEGMTPAGAPSSENFSLAPCIEYCFTDDFSFNAGCWFSVSGRNSLAFQSFVATLYYAF